MRMLRELPHPPEEEKKRTVSNLRGTHARVKGVDEAERVNDCPEVRRQDCRIAVDVREAVGRFETLRNDPGRADEQVHFLSKHKGSEWCALTVNTKRNSGRLSFLLNRQRRAINDEQENKK